MFVKIIHPVNLFVLLNTLINILEDLFSFCIFACMNVCVLCVYLVFVEASSRCLIPWNLVPIAGGPKQLRETM